MSKRRLVLDPVVASFWRRITGTLIWWGSNCRKFKLETNRRLFAVNINIAFSLPFAMTSDFATFWANFNSRQQEREAIATQQ